ncbi:leucine-rich melanocyte differentiation-associated protein-like [Schistocerca cancellata]|uniref:leucine-rich melanocyte differentiation-associated protein-like n=1 Tax=Schistocerca cancellata TaxID=274614 RepID=UPI00211920F4|nr:leucine-rich melanocyte differentiation-associated protein-like [Schistocerca cancellata]
MKTSDLCLEKDSKCAEVNRNAIIFENSKLTYVGQDCSRIPSSLIQVYAPSVHYMDLSFNQLSTLQGLEQFTLLKELVLDNNNLTDTLCLPRLQHLHTLSLNKNNIVNLELLLNKISNNLPALRYLSLLGNVACPNQLSDMEKDEEDYHRYRYYVLYRLPNLQFLDSTKVTTEERLEASRRGQLMKVVCPTNVEGRDDSPATFNSKYTPLPGSKRNIGDHQGAYGKCRYRYSGKHSEGNRFIKNNDL